MSQPIMEVRSNGIVRFLEEYKKFPCLWMKTDANYANRAKRDEAERCLLQTFKFSSAKELKRKIKNIRGTYYQERKKVKESLRTAKGLKDIYRPQLLWYDVADSFLRQNYGESGPSMWEKVSEGIREALKKKETPLRQLGTGKKIQNVLLLKVIKGKDAASTDAQRKDEKTSPQPSTSKVQPMQQSPLDTNQKRKREELGSLNQRKVISLDNTLQSDVEVLKKVALQLVSSNESNFGSYSSQPTPSQSPLDTDFTNQKRKREEGEPDNRRKIAKLDDSLQNAVEVLNKVASQSLSSNEFTTFGSYIASQLQALPIATALQLQSEIHSLITSVRLECLQKTSSPVSANCSSKEDSLNNQDGALDKSEMILNEDASSLKDTPSGKTVSIATHFSSWSQK